MEENQTNIKQIITTIDDDKSYSIDVDETTTFADFKKILASAAHLLKNCFQIYHEEREYTNHFDNNTIQEMFPNLDPIPLRIITIKDINDYEDELISLKLNIKVPCDLHIGKYKLRYCLTCQKSICSECFFQEHMNHLVEEKADYIAPAQLLMRTIFSNSSLYRADSRLSKYMDCVTYRSNLKLNIFDSLRKLIDDLEARFASCLEYFSTCEKETETNTNDNLELLKKYCIEYFIKLKNDINTQGIMIDDEIFLTLYRKLKEIEVYKNDIFTENQLKYEKLNTLLEPFIKQVDKISEELKTTFNMYLNKDIYENFKNLIEENIVEKIEREQVNDLMFRKIEVPRKSLNRKTLGTLFSYTKSGINNYKSPDKYLGNKNQDVNPFKRANYSDQHQTQSPEQLLGYNSLSSFKNNKQTNNNYATLTWDKNDGQKRLSMINEKNEITMKEGESQMYQNRKMINTTTTSTNINNINQIGVNNNITGSLSITGSNNEEMINTNITNINNRNAGHYMNSILNNNSSLNTASNMNVNTITESNTNISNINTLGIPSNSINNIEENNNIKKETTVYYTKETTNYPSQIETSKQEYNIHTVGSIPQNINEVQNNIKKTEITKTITTTTNLTGQNNMNVINTNVNNNINKNISSNNSHEITQFTTTSQYKSGTQQASSNIFGGTLVEVLTDEIKKNNNELQEKNKNKNRINETTHTEQIFTTSDGEIYKKVTKSQTVEYNNQFGKIQMKPKILFLYPVSNSNKVIGATENEKTGNIVIDFKQAFQGEDLKMEQFPEGGAFCNHNKTFYFAGGLEKQKGLGKLFIKILFQESDSKLKLVKMPNMINAHSNHTMISNGKYIFVIGGYNSNKCEYFNLNTSKWERMPNLNSEERQRPMLVIHKDYLYAFMGYTQFGILDSIERINISKLGKSKWEKVSISNPGGINLKFYGSGIFKQNDELFFVGGKLGKGNEDFDYKYEIYHFNFDKKVLTSTNFSNVGQLNFIENQLHYFNSDSIGNFVDFNDGSLASINISSLYV